MPVDKQEYARRMRNINRAFVLLTFLFFIILVSFMILLLNVRHISHKAVTLSRDNAMLLKDNALRLKQEKKDSITNCKHTYSGINDVFEIFFPKHPNAVQIKNRDKFNNRIEELKKACEKSES